MRRVYAIAFSVLGLTLSCKPSSVSGLRDAEGSNCADVAKEKEQAKKDLTEAKKQADEKQCNVEASDIDAMGLRLHGGGKPGLSLADGEEGTEQQPSGDQGNGNGNANGGNGTGTAGTGNGGCDELVTKIKDLRTKLKDLVERADKCAGTPAMLTESTEHEGSEFLKEVEEFAQEVEAPASQLVVRLDNAPGLDASGGLSGSTGQETGIALTDGPSVVDPNGRLFDPSQGGREYQLKDTFSEKYKAGLSVKVATGVKTPSNPIGSASLEASISGNKTFEFEVSRVGTVYITAPGQGSNLFGINGRGEEIINMVNRDEAGYYCAQQATLAFSDTESLGTSVEVSGQAGSIVYVNVKTSGSVENSWTTKREHVFLVKSPIVVLKKGAQDITVRSVIDACKAWFDRYKNQLESDMATRARNWVYYNPETECNENRDCEGLNNSRAVLGMYGPGTVDYAALGDPNRRAAEVRDYKSRRYGSTHLCVPKGTSGAGRVIKACKLHGLEGQSCYTAGAEASWTLPCYPGLSCQIYRTEGVSIWRKSFAHCTGDNYQNFSAPTALQPNTVTAASTSTGGGGTSSGGSTGFDCAGFKRLMDQHLPALRTLRNNPARPASTICRFILNDPNYNYGGYLGADADRCISAVSRIEDDMRPFVRPEERTKVYACPNVDGFHATRDEAAPLARKVYDLKMENAN